MMVKQERAVRTRQMLVRAAAESFARDGFALASLTTISRRAGVSTGALHFHFASKRALADAVLHEAAAALERTTGRADRAPDPLRALVEATHGLMDGIVGDAVVRAGFALSGDPARTRGDVDLRQQWQRWIERTLQRAEWEGRLAEGTSCAQIAPTVVAATVGFEVLGCRDPDWLTRRKIDRFWELMLPRLTDGATARG
ncbi:MULTISPECIES: ScbR family autoregulator-binding transcription factor, partial [unclassified Streptomyces]|uniref:ScbR family autoregulator-binding transcription factor n=1 Tax=unclassified Streptomyces TaxID=2593676 RepID=UPI001F02B23A